MRLSKKGKQELQKTCNLFPEVRWDRYCAYPKSSTVFGWISREDGKFDVLLLYFTKDKLRSYMTTSSRYSVDFGERLAKYLDTGLSHQSCKRVEYLRLPINSIKLRRRTGQSSKSAK